MPALNGNERESEVPRLWSNVQLPKRSSISKKSAKGIILCPDCKYST